MPDPDEPEWYDTRPWYKRKRIIPTRTYSGKVVYERKRHTMTEKDATRIMDAIKIPENGDSNWLLKLILSILSMLFKLLQRAWFLVDRTIIQALIGKIEELIEWAVKTAQQLGIDYLIFIRNLIFRCAELGEFDITLKQKGK